MPVFCWLAVRNWECSVNKQAYLEHVHDYLANCKSKMYIMLFCIRILMATSPGSNEISTGVCLDWVWWPNLGGCG